MYGRFDIQIDKQEMHNESTPGGESITLIVDVHRTQKGLAGKPKGQAYEPVAWTIIQNGFPIRWTSGYTESPVL